MLRRFQSPIWRSTGSVLGRISPNAPIISCWGRSTFGPRRHRYVSDTCFDVDETGRAHHVVESPWSMPVFLALRNVGAAEASQIGHTPLPERAGIVEEPTVRLDLEIHLHHLHPAAGAKNPRLGSVVSPPASLALLTSLCPPGRPAIGSRR